MSQNLATAFPRKLSLTDFVVRRPGYLFNAWVDFMCLGGGSLLLLPLMAWAFTQFDAVASAVMFSHLLAHIINAPHFAHSYQIFYRGFGDKLRSPELPRALRIKYGLAGIFVPALLVGLLGAAMLLDRGMLGLGVNAMFFFVGWHYVKQGYGMMILDSVLKRRFLTALEKNLLLANAYACWGTCWLMANQLARQNDHWGVPWTSIETPRFLFLTAATLCGVTTAAVIVLFVRRARTGALPWNGIFAYFAALYPWLFARYTGPITIAFVPAFHSLQYLVVAWRFELNRESNTPITPEQRSENRFESLPIPPFVTFLLTGVLLGYFGFHALPETLDFLVPYEKKGFTSAMFVFGASIFINIHHYFIDSVMWRRGNPETQRHLFS